MPNFVISTQRKKDITQEVNLTWPTSKKNLKASNKCASTLGLAMHARSHIAQPEAAMDSCFALIMADTARVI